MPIVTASKKRRVYYYAGNPLAAVCILLVKLLLCSRWTGTGVVSCHAISPPKT
jgi:hypothetical protein